MPTIRVQERDINEGQTGEMFHCAVAKAAQRDLGDNEAHVFEDDYELCLEAHSRMIQLPAEAAAFVRAFDDGETVAPLAFELPNYAEWKESCCNCGHWFDPSELDGEGFCDQCQ
jgi:hypothetical protein